jgi:ammonia channel protein AmtB
MILTALFADKRVNKDGANGAFYGNGKLLGEHIAALVCVGVGSFLASYVICLVVKLIVPLRVTADEEDVGLDRRCGSRRARCCAASSSTVSSRLRFGNTRSQL